MSNGMRNLINLFEETLFGNRHENGVYTTTSPKKLEIEFLFNDIITNDEFDRRYESIAEQSVFEIELYEGDLNTWPGQFPEEWKGRELMIVLYFDKIMCMNDLISNITRVDYNVAGYSASCMSLNQAMFFNKNDYTSVVEDDYIESYIEGYYDGRN